jgi:hypothetical protein
MMEKPTSQVVVPWRQSTHHRGDCCSDQLSSSSTFHHSDQKDTQGGPGSWISAP